MLGAVLLLGSIVWIIHRRLLKKAARASARNCLDEVTQLKSLLLLIQRHRGLSSGYLNGDPSLGDAIVSIETDISSHWERLNQQHTHLLSDALYEGIKEHWQRLRARWKEHQIDNNIEQHNRLILNLLYLIENEAEQSALLVRMGRTQGCDVIWKELLETIEAIGQTRAIGTGIVACGACSAVERIRLNFLLDKMSQHLSELEQSFTRCDNSEKQIHLSCIRKAKSQTDVLKVFVEQHLTRPHSDEYACSGKPVVVSSEHFFRLASAAIEPLDDLFNHASQQLGDGLM